MGFAGKLQAKNLLILKGCNPMASINSDLQCVCNNITHTVKSVSGSYSNLHNKLSSTKD